MAVYQRLTERVLASGVTTDDLIHIVITGDTTQDPDGSSYKAKISQVFDLFSPDFVNTTGDTMTGPLIVPTISATTYQNLPTDITITGGTYGGGTATFRNNTGGTFTVTGFLSNATTAVTLSSNVLRVTSSGGTPTTTTINGATGGTYSNGTITLAGTGTLSTITGLFTGGTDVRVTGATYSNNTFTFTNNTGGTFSVLFNTVTGLTTNGNLTVTGTTSSGVISATTYQNLPTGYYNTTGITTSQSITWDKTYWGVSGSSNVDLILPTTTSKDGYSLIIKDEGGTAGTYRIRVIPTSGLIDGNTYIDMNINFMSLTFVARNNNWWII